MKKAIHLAVICALAVFALASTAWGQTIERDDYTLELPSSSWQPVKAHPDEFVNGERFSGYLRIRPQAVERGTNVSEFARHEEETRLSYMPGFAAGRYAAFSGRLQGIVFTYEYTNENKWPAAGCIYYLQGAGTIYVLHFQGVRDKLQRIRNQTDAIARSFRAN